MNEKDFKDRLKYLHTIADEYGQEEVYPSRVYKIADEVIRPVQLGLTELKPGYYAVNAGPDIVQLLKLFPAKGASYHLQWGISLACMPHKWNPVLRWHRTLKSSRFDVWENAFEYLDLDDKHWRECERFQVSRLNGEIHLRKQMDEMWTRSAMMIREWFAATSTLSGVLSAIDGQIERVGGSSHHYPPLSLVRVFTLSRIGEIEEARLGLKVYFQDSGADTVDRTNLSAALESVAETWRGAVVEIDR